MMHRFAFVLALGFLLPLLASAPAHAQATRTWVSGVGDDVNPCSRTAPCKTFAGAISKTAAGGEINCLDPAGFGTLTITKSITIDCRGTLGSVLNSGGINGFVINDSATSAPNTIAVTIRNVAINGAGTTLGLNGIRFISGRSLSVENVTIENFSSHGIHVQKAAIGFLTVRNVSFNKGAVGIKLESTAQTITASIDNSRFNNLGFNGVQAGQNATVGISNSIFSSLSGNAMFATTSSSTIYAENNVVTNSGTGISATAPGAKINASNNALYGSTTEAFNVGAGATFLSANNNKIDINPGDPATGALTLR